MSATHNTPPPPPEGVVHTAWARAWDMAQTLPALERQAFEDSMLALVDEPESVRNVAFLVLYKVLYPRYRGRKVAQNDRKSRTIIGARVPRAFAAQCKWAAEANGLSTTKWCYKALLTALTHDMAHANMQTFPVTDNDDDDDDEYSYLL